MCSMQLFFNQSLILSPVLIVACLGVFLFGQCEECCCPGSDSPALCCASPAERVTSSAGPVAKAQRSEIAAQQLLIAQECLPWLQWLGPASSVICNGWADGSQPCSASTGAWGTASCSVARWKSRAQGGLQPEMENSLGLCVLDGWFRRARDQNLL